MKLICLSGDRTDQEFALPLRKLVVGRADDADLPIPDPSVSGHHAELTVSEFGVRVRDLGSTNGTQVNGTAVTDSELRDGQIVTFGSVSFRVELPPVHIAVPVLPVEALPTPAILPDGQPACDEHRDVPAVFQCRQCARTFCDDCVRRLGLSGGPVRLLCPRCSGPCQPLVAANRKSKATGFRAWVDTIRLKFRPPGSS